MAAAARLRIAQPALSRQMVALERDVGVTLLHRERRGVRATSAGVALGRGAEDVFNRLASAVNAATAAEAGTTGLVRLGIARLALDNPRVMQAVAAARRAFPGIELDVGDVTSLTQPRALRAREIDLAIGLADFEGDATVKRAVLYEETIDHVLLAPHHPLSLRGAVAAKELRDYTMLSPRRPVSGGYLRMYQAMHDAGITQVEEYEMPEALYAMVAAGRGWVVATRPQIANPPLGTTAVPVRGMAFTLQVSLRWRGAERSRATLNVLQALRAGIGGDVLESPDERSAARVAVSRAHDVELTQIIAFLAAVEEGSMSGAALRLGLTQSGVSRRVHALERAVGCRLMERATHGVYTTNAGDAFVRDAAAVVRLTDQAVARARLAAGNVAGMCRIGAMPPELTGPLQNLALRQLVEQYPRVRVELAEMLPEVQGARLLSGEIDIGLGGSFPGMPTPRELESVQLFEDVIDSVMLMDGHPLASRAWIRASELAGEPFLFIDRGRGRRVYDAITRGLMEAGFTGPVGATHDGPRSIWRAVAAGGGWTIGTRSQRARPPAGLVGVPVEGLHIPWGVGLTWRRGESDPVVRQVLDVFRTTRNPEVAVVVATMRMPLPPEAALAQ